MIGVLIAGAFIAAAIVILGRLSGPVFAGTITEERPDPDATDLPCPWCDAPTSESDSRCPSCDQRFG